MGPELQLQIVLRLVAVASAWGIWWFRRGRSRRLVCWALTVWLAATSAVLVFATPLQVIAVDTAGILWLALATAWRRKLPAWRRLPKRRRRADAEEQAVEEIRRLVRILEASPDLVATFDSRGTLSYLNPSGLELLGFPPSVLGSNISDFLAPEARRRLDTEVLPALQTEDVWVGEIELLGSDGAELPTRQVVVAHRAEDGEVEMYSSIAHSISERQAAEKALRDSEAKFAAAFRHSLDSVILTAFPSGEVLEVNRGFTLITGIERQEALGRTAPELGLWIHPEDRERMMRALRDEGRIHELEADFLHAPSGGSRRGMLWGELIDVRGRSCLLSVVRDVTDAKRREQERAGFVAELERKNRELERFAYTVAHDLRSPLQSIQGFVELAELDLEQQRAGEVPEHLARIRGGAERLQELLESLLELSRAGKVIKERRPVELGALVGEALELLAASVGRSGAEIVVAKDLPTLRGDRNRLLQVLQNLLANALGATTGKPGGRVEVGVRVGTEPPVVFVRDNGVGIEAEKLESIFELFQRGTDRGEGSGIGLALVKKIVEVHGGRVWAESEGLGRGATFCFELSIEGVDQS